HIQQRLTGGIVMTADAPTNPGAYKGAVVLASLGTELAAKVLSCLPEKHVEPLIEEMARLAPVPPDERDMVMQDMEERIVQAEAAVSGGPDFARGVLAQSVGPERANAILSKLTGVEDEQPRLQT